MKFSDLVKVPSFIEDHPIFKHYPVKKVFPCIGLPNYDETIDVNMNRNVPYSEFILLLDMIKQHVLSAPTLKEKELKIGDAVPLNGERLVFSSDPIDIITMSMRGLTSCVNWEGAYKTTLVGSVVDPYCGVIYIADKSATTDYGSKIHYRSIVRLVQIAGNYGLFLEKSYCFNTNYTAYVRNIFKNYLRSRVPLPIYEPREDGTVDPQLTIPLSEPVKELLSYNPAAATENAGWVAYRDSKLKYSTTVDCDWAALGAKCGVAALSGSDTHPDENMIEQ